MTLRIPREPAFVLFTLQTNGFEGYIVGGAVRDLLLEARGKAASETDFDFTTNAKPEEILNIFPNSFYENQFGTVSITPTHLREMMGVAPTETPISGLTEERQKVIDLQSATKVHVSLNTHIDETTLETKEKNYEITTYRSDGVYTDFRRPDTVTWGKTIEDDVSRRDFTINAMALKIPAAVLQTKLETAQTSSHLEFQSGEFELLDLFEGQKDLETHTIRPVGDPAVRFTEDALRMLRAVRFSVQLNMRMTDETFTAIAALAENIQHVSWERIRDEFIKMLKSEYPAEAIELLEETGLLHFLLPELREGKGVEQGGHHTTDVWTHSIDALRHCPSRDPIVRFATLLHDVAKPRTFKLIHGSPTFYNHEIVGARVAKDVAKRFRLSKYDCDRIFTLVRYHMFYYQPTLTDAAIRRFMRKVGLQNVNDILDLRQHHSCYFGMK